MIIFWIILGVCLVAGCIEWTAPRSSNKQPREKNGRWTKMPKKIVFINDEWKAGL